MKTIHYNKEFRRREISYGLLFISLKTNNYTRKIPLEMNYGYRII
nr:MAG TPA: hypothetical protein [Caudoviricetes sp.]